MRRQNGAPELFLGLQLVRPLTKESSLSTTAATLPEHCQNVRGFRFKRNRTKPRTKEPRLKAIILADLRAVVFWYYGEEIIGAGFMRNQINMS